MFWPAAVRRVFVYGDLGSFLLPLRIYLAQSLERGITPLWMPNLFCGYYAHGEGAIGIFHPLRWLIYRFLPVSEAFNLECLIPYPFALVGMTLFLRRLALPASAALFGGLSFAFCPYMTVRLTHMNAIAVIAHLGWLLLAIDVLLREAGPRQRRAWLAIALLTGSQLLVGYPIAIAYCWLIAIPYALFVAASRRQLWPLLSAAGAFAAGILIGGIQVVPTWDHLTGSLRAQPTYEFLTEQSLHPWNLLTVVAPWLFRLRLYKEDTLNPIEQTLYFGPVVPIAACWVLLRWNRLGRLRSLVAWLLAMSAVALVLALGKHTGLYRWVALLPVFGLLRVPARFSILLYFAGALFAAFAFADLQRRDPSREQRRRIGWLWMIPVASWLVAGIASGLRDPSSGQAWFAGEQNPARLIVLGPLAFTLAAALFTAAARGHRAALFGLAALALVDHAVYGATLWWWDPPQTLADYRAAVPKPTVLPPNRVASAGGFGFHSTVDRPWAWWSSTQLIVHDAQLVSGYAGLMPAKRLDYRMIPSLRVAGAAEWFAEDRFEELPGALPRARLVTRAVATADPLAEITAIDVATTALVDEPVELEAGAAGEATIEQDDPGAVRIATHAATRQLLVLAESFHSGWRVEVDGEEASVIRVNGDFMGAVVEAGAHELQFRFAPRSYALGRALSFAGLAVVAAVALTGVRAAPRPHPTPG